MYSSPPIASFGNRRAASLVTADALPPKFVNARNTPNRCEGPRLGTLLAGSPVPGAAISIGSPVEFLIRIRDLRRRTRRNWNHN